jgi:hypothetical protein
MLFQLAIFQEFILKFDIQKLEKKSNVRIFNTNSCAKIIQKIACGPASRMADS